MVVLSGHRPGSPAQIRHQNRTEKQRLPQGERKTGAQDMAQAGLRGGRRGWGHTGMGINARAGAQRPPKCET